MTISHTNSTYIHHKKDSNTQKCQEIGGKATQLHNIAPDLVPNWVAITADCPDDALSEVVHEAWGKLFDQAKHNKGYFQTFAVRSSAVDEDGEKQSYAGIFESKLNVPASGLEHAVREVRDSNKTQRLKAYHKGIDETDLTPSNVEELNLNWQTYSDMKVAVIIMPMVDAKYSGVLFTKEPLGGSNKGFLEYEEGVGGVVDGTGDSIRLFLDPEDLWDSKWLLPQGGSVQKIWAEAKRLERNYGKPLDIEWAIDKSNKPWVLQVRPITA